MHDTATPLHHRLEREPTDTAPGRHESDDLTLAWDLQALTLREPGREPHTVPFDGCALQLSRAQLEPRPRGWRRLLGFASSPVAHLVVELRPRVGPRTQLTAAAPEAMLAGLPRLQPGHGHHAVTLDGLLALVDAARAGGASLVHGPAEADVAPDEEVDAGPTLRFGLRPAAWLRVALASCAAVAAAWFFVNVSEAWLTQRWYERSFISFALLLTAFFVPQGALARTGFRRVDQGRKARATGYFVVAGCTIFVTLGVVLSVLEDVAPRPVGVIAGIIAMQTAAWFGLPLLGAWHGVHLDARGVTLRRFGGLLRRRVPWNEVAKLHDALFAPAMRFAQSPGLLALALRASHAPRPAEVLEGASGKHAAHVAWPGELIALEQLPRSGRAAGIAISIVLAALVATTVAAMLPEPQEAWALVPALLLGALCAKLVVDREAALVDLHFGLILRHHRGLGSVIVTRVWQDRLARPGARAERLALPPGSWLEGCSLTHIATARASVHGNQNVLELVPYTGSEALLRQRALTTPLPTGVHFLPAESLAATLDARRRRLELEPRPEHPEDRP